MALKHWIKAFRLRTLPLAMASIGMGSFLAVAYKSFSWITFILTTLTTILLQILSNLANDYGDSIHGADLVAREGPQRTVQSGAISKKSMQLAMLIFGILSFICGVLLLTIAIDSIHAFFIFLGLGLLSIVAAVTYTAGKKPYGYAGLGDISVLIFFGFVAVLGTFYLHTKMLLWEISLPALSSGLLAVAVLNVNNIRDIKSDREAGKKSIPVRLGRSKAVWYHFTLLITAFIASLIYVALFYKKPIQLIFLIVIPFLFVNAKAVAQKKNPKELDPYLKQMALTSLLFVISFGIGQILV